MQFRTTGLLLLGAMALPAPGTAQTTRAPPAITRTVVAGTKLPAPFQSCERHSPDVREERRLGGQRHPLPDVRIDRGLARWRGQNAQRWRGAIHRQRKDGGVSGGQQRAINFPPLLPCPRCGLGSVCRNGTCRRQRAISHRGSNPRPEAGRLRSQPHTSHISGADALQPATSSVRSGSVLYYFRHRCEHGRR